MAAICQQWSRRGLTQAAVSTLLQQWSEGTRQRYTWAYGKFAQWHEQHYPGQEVIPEHVVNFCQHYREQQDYQASSIIGLVRGITAILSKLGRWKDETGLIAQYVRGITNEIPRHDRRADPIPSLEKLLVWLLHSRDKTSMKMCRSRAIILCRMVTLARSKDIAGWLASSVSFEEDSVTVRTERTKRKARSRSYILPRLPDCEELCPYTAFADYWSLMKDKSSDQYVWRAVRHPYEALSADSVGRISREALREAGYSSTELRSHDLRMVSASLVIRNGGQPGSLQVAGGWESYQTMDECYIRRPEAAQDVAQLILQLLLRGAREREREGQETSDGR